MRPFLLWWAQTWKQSCQLGHLVRGTGGVLERERGAPVEHAREDHARDAHRGEDVDVDDAVNLALWDLVEPGRVRVRHADIVDEDADGTRELAHRAVERGVVL